jgi:hypothetical protein
MVINNVSSAFEASEKKTSKAMLWTGRITWALAVPFMLFDISIHLANPSFVQEAAKQSNFNPALMPVIGTIALVCMALYLIRRTAVLGATLLTGYLGGAVCAHMIQGTPGWFAIFIGALLWTSLYCRDARVRTLI